jgi:uncharacterized membrane protein
MNSNRKFYFYQGKPPAYILPLILLLGIVVFAVLAVFGFFLGIAVGVVLIVFGIMRLFSSNNKKKVTTVGKDGRTTIILDKEDYEVIEKGKK